MKTGSGTSRRFLTAALRTDDHEKLARIFPTGRCNVWGFKHGPSDQDTFYDLREGDKAMFFNDDLRSFTSIWCVALKVNSAALARAVWPGDFFVRKRQLINLPLELYVQLVRYDSAYWPRRILIVNGEKAEAVLRECRQNK